jgi:hypothetical protein
MNELAQKKEYERLWPTKLWITFQRKVNHTGEIMRRISRYFPIDDEDLPEIPGNHMIRDDFNFTRKYNQNGWSVQVNAMWISIPLKSVFSQMHIHDTTKLTWISANGSVLTIL